MKWKKFTLETTTEAVDLVSSTLGELGIEGIEIVDQVPLTEEEKKQMFVDIIPDHLFHDDNQAKVIFYMDPEVNSEQMINDVTNELKELEPFVDLGSCKITVSETADKDWMNNWKKYFKPFRIDNTIVIKPTWEELRDYKEDDVIIEIDPGSSFGTGSHETTKLCILGLKKHMKPDDIILDAGSGSGILSIVAKKLGAKEVLGIDIDVHAVDSAIENAQVNQLWLQEGDLSFIAGNVIEDGGIREKIGKGKFDLVVANILADVIIPLSDVIDENMKPGGLFLCSGIIDSKEEAVRAALLNNNFQILEVNRLGEWVSFVATK